MTSRVPGERAGQARVATTGCRQTEERPSARARGLLHGLLPPGVVVVESTGAEDQQDGLSPAEAAVVAGSVLTRRREFAAGRHCARQALAQLGSPTAALLPGPDRAPRWPAGVVGSLTHCTGHVAAAVAWAATPPGRLVGLGIDVEPHRALPAGVLEEVSSDHERLLLADLPGGTAWGTVLFSAKESLYKAWSPLTGRWLDFTDAKVTLHPAGAWTARLLVPGPLRTVRGRFSVDHGLVATALAVPAGALRGVS